MFHEILNLRVALIEYGSLDVLVDRPPWLVRTVHHG
jgi:hypothetical protein